MRPPDHNRNSLIIADPLLTQVTNCRYIAMRPNLPQNLHFSSALDEARRGMHAFRPGTTCTVIDRDAADGDITASHLSGAAFNDQ